jgi:hypothetical protein
MANAGPKIVPYFLAAGFLVPCLLLLVISVGNVQVGGAWTWIFLIPWPTFLFLMSAEAGGGTPGFLMAFFISAAANVFVYGVVGTAISFSYRRFFFR